MMKHNESPTSRYSRRLTIVNRFFIIFLIFCFAGCAAGSCLSYGHSCWGAHGKRSYNGAKISGDRQIGASDGRVVAELDTVDNPAPMNHWFLSRLIKGRLAAPAAASIVGKHLDNRWHERQSILALPENWDDDYDTARNGIFRTQKDENAASFGDLKDLDDSLDLMQKVKNPRDETTELLFVPSRNEYVDHDPSHARKLRLYKILTDSSDDTL